MNSPKRNHSLVHLNEHLAVPTPQRSSSITRLARSSSLSHLHRKTPTRSNSLPQKPIKVNYNAPLPPIPPFLLEEQPKIIPPTRSTSLLRQPRKIVKNHADEDITKALLEWKHKSLFKVDWANMFSPSVELWKMNDNIFGSVEDLLNFKNNDSDSVEIERVSNALWMEDESFVTKKEIAAYLGKLDPFCHCVLKQYMDYFDFTALKLDEAFRKLCSKLYFKAEAQEIDRILEVFSYKYWHSNIDSQTTYRNADIVYTITYSIMLLNTDLHLVQISSHAKMTSDLFCENTMSTVMEQNPGDHDLELWKEQLVANLMDIYTSVKNNGILQPVSEEEAPKSFLKRMGSMAQRKKKLDSSPSN